MRQFPPCTEVAPVETPTRRVTLLYCEGCPSWQTTRRRLHGLACPTTEQLREVVG